MNNMIAVPIKGRIRQRGLAMVEFTIVLPLLLLLMLAAAEFGRGLFQYNTLTKAVRDGARYYAENAFLGNGKRINSAEVTTATNQNTTVARLVRYGNEAGTGNLLLSPNPPIVITSVDATSEYVTVSATYDFQFIPGNPLAGIMTLFGSSNLSNEISLVSSTTMRAL